MNQSKNMVFKITPESEDLKLYIDNNSALQRHMDIVNEMLDGKRKRNVFNSAKAWKAYYKVCNHATELYAKSFGYRFSTQERYTVAVMLSIEYVADRQGYVDTDSFVQGVD